MKKLKFDFGLQLMFMTVLTLFMLQACVALNGEKMKTWSEMTPKEKVTMSYGTYNSQFTSYMTETGWMMNINGKWEKITTPVLSEEQKNMLRKKKAILVKMWPMIKIYDSMTLGKAPYSAKTEADLYNLIEDIAGLVPG